MSFLTGAGPKHTDPQFWGIVMAEMTRKSFLRLAAAATTSAAFASQASAQAPSVMAPRLTGSTSSLLISGADLLTMDPALQEIEGGDVLPWCTTPIEAESSLGPDSHHPIISLSGIPSAVMVLRILHPILASTLCAANPLARIAEPTIAL